MKTKVIVSLTFLIICGSFALNASDPEEHLSEKVKVIYGFDNSTKSLTSIYSGDETKYEKADPINFDRVTKRTFLVGYINGDYEQKGNDIFPSKGTTLTIHKNESYKSGDESLPGDMFYPEKKFLPGDMFVISNERGKLKVEVIKNSREQIVINIL